MRKRYNTPHRSRIVKTRMTEEEYAEFAERLSACNMSQAEFIRQAITGAAIRPIITVSPVNDELLAAVGKLTAEYGRIGGNLNQIDVYKRQGICCSVSIRAILVGPFPARQRLYICLTTGAASSSIMKFSSSSMR